MEPKTGSRTIKKSAGGGVLGDRRKSRQKKKKEKRKASVKGTESTDVPSPELDSEVPLEGEVSHVQDGRSSPVTRFPQLTSQSSVSLTTQTSTPPPILVTAASSSSSTTTRKLSLAGGQASSNSAPTTRSAIHASSSSTTTTTLLSSTTSANQLDGVVARVASLNIKQRSSNKSRSKAQGAKSSGKSSRARGNNTGGPNKTSQAAGSSAASKAGGPNGSAGAAAATSNESLRWEKAVENVEEERERIAVYKMNRRKRYLAAAQAKGLGWAMNYNCQSAVTPMSEDSGVETGGCGSPGMMSGSASAGAYIDFSSMQTLRPIPAHRGLQEAFVEC